MSRVKTTSLSSTLSGRVLLLTTLLAICIGFSATAVMAASAPQQAATATANAQNLTNKLIALHTGRQQAAAADQPAIEVEMANIAMQRKQELVALIDHDNAALLRLTVPAEMRSGMPTSVQAQVEAQVELDGELQVFYEDYKDNATLRHVLHANGKRYSLHFAGNVPDALSGSQVHVRAVQVDTADLVLEALTSTTSTSATTLAVTSAALPNTFGVQNTLVLLVNFQDLTTQPWSTTTIWNTMFGATGSVSAFFKEASLQQTSAAGNVYGWYTLPLSSATCDTTSIAADAKAAASAAGVNLANYSHYVYVFNNYLSACGWMGLAEVGGSNVWINGYPTEGNIAHELGHNLGLSHSHSLQCTGSILGSNCGVSQYGDAFDTMGNVYYGHYNSFQKERLGWLNYGISPPITTVTSSGTFYIEPYETATSGVKALKIYNGNDPTTGQAKWYYVEFRQPLGFDSFIGTDSTMGTTIPYGVLIRSAADGNANSSVLLDMTPDSTLYKYQDVNDGALGVGKSFTDPNTGLTITTTSASSTGAGVTVSFGAATPVCTHANPSVTLSPGQSATVAPGTAVSFTATVTNKDSSGCSTSLFNLSDAVPTGWTGSLAKTSVSLAPGASASTTFTVTSATSASAALYNVSVTAANSSATAYTGSGTATYVVGSTTTTTTTSTTKGKGRK